MLFRQPWYFYSTPCGFTSLRTEKLLTQVDIGPGIARDAKARFTRG